MGDTVSSPFPPRESLATDTSGDTSTARLNTTSDSCFFSCIHCCHGHVFTVVLMGAGFTLLILQTERKCHEFNLWSLISTTSCLCYLSRAVTLTVFSGNIEVRIDRHLCRKLGIKQTENEKHTLSKRIINVHGLLSFLSQLVFC